METKEQLVQTIKQWVKIDNEIRALQKEQVARKKEKKNISARLMECMRNNEIDCFDMNDGQIMYTKKNVKKPITQKMLLPLIAQYYQGDLLKASQLNNYILDNREETVVENIVRKIYNNDS
jgi:hypothetical protein